MYTEIFSKNILLMGEKNQKMLSEKTVAVFGLGGVGSWTVEALARVGIGSFLLCDCDYIELSNINRQLIALHSTVGKPKIQIAENRIKDINPAADVTVLQERCGDNNIAELLAKEPDFVIDAIDDVRGKAAIISYCHEQGIPGISSMGTANLMSSAGFSFSDIGETAVCPLARSLRKNLRERGINGGWKVLCNTRPQQSLINSSGPEPGTIVFVPALAGLKIAEYTVEYFLHKN